MAKTPTKWFPGSSGTATDDNTGDFLLLENGDNILLEDGDDILLEDIAITERQPIVWTDN